MPERITKLTPEQIARIPEWVERWTAIGLSTEPADFDAAGKAVLALYDAIGKPRPRVLRMSSPFGACAAGVMALGDKQVASQVGSQVRSQVVSQVASEVRSQVVSQVASEVASEVWSQVRSQVESQVVNNLYQGQFWAGWIAYVTFLRDVCGWTNPTLDAFAHAETLAKSCGYVWWHDDVAVISDRPQAINRDSQGRPHSEVGSSIAYRDGWALHHWHGTLVPAHWIEKRADLDPVEVLKSKNVEQRVAGANLIGWPKMLTKLKRKIIDGDPDSDLGALIELKIPGLREPGRFLQAKCPRNGTIVEGVPRVSDIDNLPIETVIAAQAWRVGDPQSEYDHPQTRT